MWAMQAETITMRGGAGDDIRAYLARPTEPGTYPAVVVVHHRPGWDREVAETTRRLAAAGFVAVCPNLHERDAPGADPATAARAAQEAGGVPDARMLADVAAAVDLLRGLPEASGKVGVIGYCSGGRQAWIVACTLPVDAAVVCYGGRIVAGPEDLSERTPVAPIEMTPSMGCPLLGLFGAHDRNPSPDDVARMGEALRINGKEHELHVYADAGHAFFSVDSPKYCPEAAVDGWGRVLAFLERTLGAPGRGQRET